MPFSLEDHYAEKELGKSCTCPAKTVMQRVSKSAMRIGYQEDATYIRSKYHDNKGSFVRSQVSSGHLHNIAG